MKKTLKQQKGEMRKPAERKYNSGGRISLIDIAHFRVSEHGQDV